MWSITKQFICNTNFKKHNMPLLPPRFNNIKRQGEIAPPAPPLPAPLMKAQRNFRNCASCRSCALPTSAFCVEGQSKQLLRCSKRKTHYIKHGRQRAPIGDFSTERLRIFIFEKISLYFMNPI